VYVCMKLLMSKISYLVKYSYKTTDVFTDVLILYIVANISSPDNSGFITSIELFVDGGSVQI
jgi:hypothetical protein